MIDSAANLEARIEGQRIILRNVRERDVSEGYCLWMNDPEVTRFLECRFQEHTEDDLRAFVARMEQDPDNVFLAIVLRDGDRHIGNLKISSINWLHRFADIGLLIGDKSCWGQNFGSEAIRLATDYAFDALELHSLSAGLYDANIGSLKAFGKAGWQQQGLRKSRFLCEGEHQDQILMGIVRDDA